MKSRFKQILTLSAITLTITLSSCGNKDNKVNSSGANTGMSGSTPFTTSNPALGGGNGSTIINQVQSIKANVSCLSGYRLSNDVSFYVNGGYIASNRIGGNFQQGFLTNGSYNKLWVGISAFRDIMFVTQVTNGSQVVGFNVTISFCELKNSNPYYPSIISNDRSLDSFNAPNGIILDSNTYCGYNVVDLAANTLIVSRKIPGNPGTPVDVQIPTSFTKPTCNGQF